MSSGMVFNYILDQNAASQNMQKIVEIIIDGLANMEKYKLKPKFIAVFVPEVKDIGNKNSVFGKLLEVL